MSKRVLGTVAVFGVGVGIGCAAAPLVVPKANAQQAAQLTAWEVTCSRGDWAEMIAAAQRAGAKRWELVSHVADGREYSVCLKRPKM